MQISSRIRDAIHNLNKLQIDVNSRLKVSEYSNDSIAKRIMNVYSDVLKRINGFYITDLQGTFRFHTI